MQSKFSDRIWLQGENELEEELLDQVQSCLGAVLEQFGDAAMPLMEGLMPQIGTLLTPKSSIEERRVGICVMDDIMEHTKEGEAVLELHLRCSHRLRLSCDQCHEVVMSSMSQHRLCTAPEIASLAFSNPQECL